MRTTADFAESPIPDDDFGRLLTLLFGEDEPTSDEAVAVA